MELEYGHLTFQINDEYWKNVVQAIEKKIQNNLVLLNKYERGEKITVSFPLIYVEGDKQKEIEILLEASKPIPILGKTILQLPEGGLFPKEGLKVNLGKLKISKKTTLNEKTMVETEEGIIEQIQED